jgi:hypothetical protein
MYFALDAGFTSSAAIEELGETHGAAGPMVVISLLASAKQQGDGGRVRTTRRKLAADAFLAGVDEAQRIVEHAATAGVIEIYGLDKRAIYVGFPRWDDWQPRAQAAARQAAKRAADRAAGNGKIDTEEIAA